MTYEKAREYMLQLQKKGSIYGLDTVRRLAEKMGNPQENIPVVHIAGTNGKGSVGTLLAAVLACAGYKVGRFTSPAVLDTRESITFTCKAEVSSAMPCTTMISEEEYADGILKIKNCIERMQAEEGIEPTAFEAETVLAYAMFEKWQCDIAIVEAGLGGREDATNIVSHPLLAVITDISMDHMQLLGNTLREIAGHKAGIIKQDSKVVTIMQDAIVMSVLHQACARMNSCIMFAKEQNVSEKRYSFRGDSFAYMDSTGKTECYKIQMHGTYQMRNAILAIEAALCLAQDAYGISRENIKEGLFCAGWKGRFDIISETPFVIADGAHNIGAAKALESSIKQYLKDRDIIGVTGMFRDKECDLVLQTVVPLMKQVYTVTAPTGRGMDAESLCSIAKKYCDRVESCQSVEEALGKAEGLPPEKYAVLLFGSLSFLKNAYQYYSRKERR